MGLLQAAGSLKKVVSRPRTATSGLSRDWVHEVMLRPCTVLLHVVLLGKGWHAG